MTYCSAQHVPSWIRRLVRIVAKSRLNTRATESILHIMVAKQQLDENVPDSFVEQRCDFSVLMWFQVKILDFYICSWTHCNIIMQYSPINLGW